MRTKRGKPTQERILIGPPELAEPMAVALAAEELPERFTHGFHAYPAGLHPDAARDLLHLFPEGAVLDPFCGGGTVLVEARAMGRRAYGRDLSTTALRVARTRAASPDAATISAVRSAARKLAEAARTSTIDPPEPLRAALGEWYAPHALRELEALRRGIAEQPPEIRPHLWAIFSAIVVKVSWRRSDTSAQRVRHKRPPGTTAILFHKKARELGRMWEALAEVVPPGTPDADIRLGDARTIRLDQPVQLVLTSPPYPGTYDYLPMQHLRRIWMGEDRGDEEREIGSRRLWRAGDSRARKQWRADSEAWTKAAAHALAPGGHLVIVIGDGLVPTGPIDSSEVTSESARAAGLELVARVSLERPDHARASSRWEHVFAFRKPARPAP